MQIVSHSRKRSDIPIHAFVVLARMYTELQEQAADISNSGYCLSTPEIARVFCVPEFIIDYKYEAMTVRNYNVPSVELPTFDRVFGVW